MGCRKLMLTMGLVITGLMANCDGQPLTDPPDDLDPFEEPSGTSGESSFLTADDCCAVAGFLDPAPRAGCGDAAVTACVCAALPSCCTQIWGPECVVETVAVCGACSTVDPHVIAMLTTDSDGDGRIDQQELIDGTDPLDPSDGPDMDGDGILNIDDPDVDGDGTPNGHDRDTDGDGILNTLDLDVDGDGLYNLVDVDDDGDGILDVDDLDQNADGLPDLQCKSDAHCDDGNVCNGVETCSSLLGCRPGVPLDCADNVRCTVDTCDPVSGCLNTPTDSACNDGFPCTLDVCDSVVGCVHGPQEGLCDDFVDCTTDSCNVMLGCVHDSDDGACDDGVDCTVDRCDSALGCVHEPDDSACEDDGVACTASGCDPIEGCNKPQDDSCDDGIECTKDSCVPGDSAADSESGCVHQPDHEKCADINECTEDRCDEHEGCMHPMVQGADCAGDEDCDEGESCVDCTCTAGDGGGD